MVDRSVDRMTLNSKETVKTTNNYILLIDHDHDKEEEEQAWVGIKSTDSSSNQGLPPGTIDLAIDCQQLHNPQRQ